MNDAKALFFVTSFTGDKKQQPVMFHRHSAVTNGIWVRVEFEDGEMMEGLIHNSAAHLMQSGFFLLPTDPGSNNELVYVFKAAVKEFRVLGTQEPVGGSAEGQEFVVLDLGGDGHALRRTRRRARCGRGSGQRDFQRG